MKVNRWDLAVGKVKTSLRTVYLVNPSPSRQLYLENVLTMTRRVAEVCEDNSRLVDVSHLDPSQNPHPRCLSERLPQIWMTMMEWGSCTESSSQLVQKRLADPPCPFTNPG